MKYRKSIVKTLDLLIAESSKNISEDSKKDKLEAWHIGLDDISDELIFEGMKKALKMTTGYTMSCGEFRELCLVDGDNMSLEMSAYSAWGVAYSNMNRNESPFFKDPVIAETLRMMDGWKKFCSMLISEEPFIKKEFVAIYSELKKTGKNNFDQYLTGNYGSDYIHFIGYGDTEEEKLLIEQTTKEIVSGDRSEIIALKRLAEL